MSEDPPFDYLATTPPSEETLYANGIFADTGLPLCQMTQEEFVELARARRLSEAEARGQTAKHAESSEPHYGTVGDVDPNLLSEAGWGIVFPEGGSDEIRAALAPLIEHRQKQAGDLFEEFSGDRGYRAGESCTDWLARQGVGMSVVDPYDGVPFYLLLVGSPAEIPFEFQYLLDIYWGVGRLHFDELDDYRRYAESVVAYETAGSVAQSKSLAVFATSHEGDRATEMFADEVAWPLAKGQEGEGRKRPRPALGARQGFQVRDFIGESATVETLTDILSGKTDQGPPALLLTGSHGMGFRPTDGRLASQQGALVCQDWEGFGQIRKDAWFSADDLPQDANMHGLIHFFFACYGAGCPDFDDFVVKPGAPPKRLADQPIVSRLPQKMLSHPSGGALAALGHVDRAWTTSFRSKAGDTQLQSFRDVMTRLLQGQRIGVATDQFDVRRAALSAELCDVLRDMDNGREIPPEELAGLWRARNDARNYMVVGDPAVRIRVEDLAT